MQSHLVDRRLDGRELGEDVPALGVLTQHPLHAPELALGALQAASGLMESESYLTALRRSLQDKCMMIPLNEQAFQAGAEAARAQDKRSN